MCCHLKPMKTKVLKAVLAVYIIAKDVSPRDGRYGNFQKRYGI